MVRIARVVAPDMPHVEEEEAARIRLHERTGRPLGNPDWLTRLENLLKRPVTPRKRGPRGPRRA